jgi:hypothetical protein
LLDNRVELTVEERTLDGGPLLVEHAPENKRLRSQILTKSANKRKHVGAELGGHP